MLLGLEAGFQFHASVGTLKEGWLPGGVGKLSRKDTPLLPEHQYPRVNVAMGH